ncbi:MAG: response regulator [Verrucomicrobia bacterium]|nr:response regulator [Verrucomicrobiota bacterium]
MNTKWARNGDRPVRVLVVDDHATIRSFTVEALKMLGAEAVAVANAGEALFAWERCRAAGHPFGVIIVDLNLADRRSGLEVLRGIRQLDPQARAVLSSGNPHDPAMMDFRSQGFCGRLGKPYRIEELAQAVRAAVEVPDSDPPSGSPQLAAAA